MTHAAAADVHDGNLTFGRSNAMSSPVTAGRILDILTAACAQHRVYGDRGIADTFFAMSAAERVAFDLFLVRMGDVLAWQPGTVEYRFRARVKAMVTNVAPVIVLASEAIR